MKLSGLLKRCVSIKDYSINNDIEIKNIEFDSRKVKDGCLFIAVKGYTTDGHNYVKSSFENGASICIIDKDKELGLKETLDNQYHNKLIVVDNTRDVMPEITKAFLDYPDRKMTIIGITGTKGKTTTTYAIKSILEASGKKVGLIGTINYMIGDKTLESKNTTPDSLDLYKLLKSMYDEGVEYVVMEISSHALSLNRVGGLDIDIAIFSNFAQDHLDFHKNMEDYFQAKLKLFDLLKASVKKDKVAIINYDIPQYSRINEYIRQLGLSVLSYGLKDGADIRAKLIDKISLSGNKFEVHYNGSKSSFETNLIGEFNVYNTLCAISSAKFLKIDENQISTGLRMISVPGRFERINLWNNSIAIVDYAHTENALENVLITIKNLNPKRIITVFGCGGDRDKLKRPLMGAAVSKYSNIIVVTSDNPRTENPSTIIDEIVNGIKKDSNKEYFRIEDRKEAIEFALSIVKKDDVVLIAGKGHEDYQILKDKTIHFSDKEIVFDYIKNGKKSLEN